MAAVWTLNELAVGASTGEPRYWLPIRCHFVCCWSGGGFDEAIGEVVHFAGSTLRPQEAADLYPLGRFLYTLWSVHE